MEKNRNLLFGAAAVSAAGFLAAYFLELFPFLLATLVFFPLALLILTGYIDDLPSLVLASGLVLAAAVLRIIPLDFESNDYTAFLSRWVEFFRQNGGVRGLGHKIGDYNFPYLYYLSIISYLPIDDLYLIKLLSVIFDIILAFYAMLIVSLFVKNKYAKLASFFAVLLLPTIWVNSAMWGQCDSIYSAFGLMGLYYALRDRPWLSVIFVTVAFSFKLQIIFLLPIYAVLLFTGRIKIRHLFAFPATYLLITLPAILSGRPLMDLITIYTSQVGSYSSFLTLNAPSLYAFVTTNEHASYYSAAGVVTAFACLFALLFYAYIKRRTLDNRATVIIALIMVILIPLLLPSMHERYFYLADVLSVVFAFLIPGKAFVALLVQFASWSGYHAYLIGGGVGVRAGAVALVIALITVLYELFRWKNIELDRTLT